MPKSVLIVDDNEVIRRTLVRVFAENRGWSICGEATNGEEAIAMAQRCSPNFVVLDYSMPGMNGLEAAPVLKSLLPQAHIVMLTAFKDEFLERKAYQAGATWVLAKTENILQILDFGLALLNISGLRKAASHYPALPSCPNYITVTSSVC